MSTGFVVPSDFLPVTRLLTKPTIVQNTETRKDRNEKYAANVRYWFTASRSYSRITVITVRKTTWR